MESVWKGKSFSKPSFVGFQPLIFRGVVAMISDSDVTILNEWRLSRVWWIQIFDTSWLVFTGFDGCVGVEKLLAIDEWNLTPLRSNLDTQNSSVIQGYTLAGFIVLSWFQFDQWAQSIMSELDMCLQFMIGLKHVASSNKWFYFGYVVIWCIWRVNVFCKDVTQHSRPDQKKSLQEETCVMLMKYVDSARYIFFGVVYSQNQRNMKVNNC